jgi:hypothetical protein
MNERGLHTLFDSLTSSSQVILFMTSKSQDKNISNPVNLYNYLEIPILCHLFAVNMKNRLQNGSVVT